MVRQAGKTHNYPDKRKSYSTSRKGVGGRKKKPKNDEKKTKKLRKPTYFDLLKENVKDSGILFHI